jgi:hypothetical protein
MNLTFMLNIKNMYEFCDPKSSLEETKEVTWAFFMQCENKPTIK